MKKIMFTFLSLLLFAEISFSLDTVSTKYYPLKVGNSWTYYHISTAFPSQNYKYKITLENPSVINGHLYFTFGQFLQRVDSIYGRLLQFTSNGCQWLNQEILIDSLSSKLHDSCKSYCGNNSSSTYCIDTLNDYIFGMQKKSKTFVYTYFEHVEYFRYVMGIGLTYHYIQMGSPDYTLDTLQGCVINGIVYGDTSVTGVNKISTEIPNSFALFQNYPNPFNPSTNIKYQIPKTGLVKLVVYDILGKEISVLVNEKQNPGTYEVEWNAMNYSSGVYFYKLTAINGATEFTETKRMVLMK